MAFKPRSAADSAYGRYGKYAKLPPGLAATGGEQVTEWAKAEMTRLYPALAAFEVKSLTVDYAKEKGYPRLEIHHHSPQAYIPLDRPLAIPVALAPAPASADAEGDVAPDARAVEFFSVGPGEAVFVDAGVWHGGPVALEPGGARFVVLLREGTTDRDTVKKALEPALTVEL